MILAGDWIFMNFMILEGHGFDDGYLIWDFCRRLP
ncbi:hypothetical protein HNR54_001449 [Methanothermobacter sp. DSM 3267]